jgi:voltage-gated potassium channel
MLEILLWAWVCRPYCFSTWGAAFYFSATSYSTVGYGDLVLPRAWRFVGPAEIITGVLMCRLPVTFLFAAVHRLVESDERRELVGGTPKG